ncbi:MAG: phosphoglycolate phosphatase [Xanthobacteraceae bacterium]|uniref:phosphoglycolate phosphatase n=1 Tax=Pseudolabrys sp. TaxID=1960880 RepID=UPI003D131DB0
MPQPTIVFDLDGTLIDTAPDLVATLNVILAREGLPEVPYETARTFIGGGARLMLERGLIAGSRDPAPQLLNRLFEEFLAYYAEHIADRSRPFPGLERALDDLAMRGCRLAVCTNKLEGLSVTLLDALRLTSRFATICGQDTFGIQKPDPLVLHKTVAAAGGTMASAVMIGDSATDIRAAQAAGIPVIAVDFGYTDRHVSEFSPNRVIGHFDELVAAIEAVGALSPRNA